jgi:hypothetical protein
LRVAALFASRAGREEIHRAGSPRNVVGRADLGHAEKGGCKIVCVKGQNKQTTMKKGEGEEDDQKETNDDPTRIARRAVAGMLSFTDPRRPVWARRSDQAVKQGAD